MFSSLSDLLLVACCYSAIGFTNAKSIGLSLKPLKDNIKILEIKDAADSKEREVDWYPMSSSDDHHGEWIDQPFEAVEEEQYIGPSDGEFVQEFVGDSSQPGTGFFDKNDKQQTYDWGFPEHDTKQFEMKNTKFELPIEDSMTGGGWVDKRKSK